MSKPEQVVPSQSDQEPTDGDRQAIRDLIRQRVAQHQPSKNEPKEIDWLDPNTLQNIEDRKSDRTLKKTYARWFVWILVGQLVVMNAVIVGVGMKCLSLDTTVLNIYMSGTMLEIFGIVLIITNSLFRRRD